MKVGLLHYTGPPTVGGVEQTLAWHAHHLAAEIAEHNYELGRRFYSFATLERRLNLLIQDTLGTEPGAGLFTSS